MQEFCPGGGGGGGGKMMGGAFIFYKHIIIIITKCQKSEKSNSGGISRGPPICMTDILQYIQRRQCCKKTLRTTFADIEAILVISCSTGHTSGRPRPHTHLLTRLVAVYV